MSPSEIARVCHEVNRSYCLALGDKSHLPWDESSIETRETMTRGVMLLLKNPSVTPEDQHNAWLETREAQGWKFGETKDVEKKLHPCMVPYDKLPEAQRAKDYIFRGVVFALKD